MTDNKTIEQEAAEKYPRFHPYAEYENELQMARREGYIAGRTASANEKGKLIKGEYISGWIKWGNGGYPKKSGLHNVILREKGESWVAWWNTHKKRFEEAVPEFSDKGVDVDYWQPLPAPPSQLTGGEVSEGQGEKPPYQSNGYDMSQTEYLLRVNLDRVCQERDDARNEAKVLGAIKKGLETSLKEALKKVAELESQLSEGTAKGGELKDIIARIIEQNNNPTATAKIIALVEEHYSSQEAKGGEYKFSRDEQKKEIEKFLRASFPEDYFFVDSLDNVPLDEITEIILQYIEIHSAAASQEAKAIAEKVEKAYWQWCKETKRNGSVLVGGSIKEFFQYLSKFSSPTENEK